MGKGMKGIGFFGKSFVGATDNFEREKKRKKKERNETWHGGYSTDLDRFLSVIIIIRTMIIMARLPLALSDKGRDIPNRFLVFFSIVSTDRTKSDRTEFLLFLLCFCFVYFSIARLPPPPSPPPPPPLLPRSYRPDLSNSWECCRLLSFLSLYS